MKDSEILLKLITPATQIHVGDSTTSQFNSREDMAQAILDMAEALLWAYKKKLDKTGITEKEFIESL